MANKLLVKYLDPNTGKYENATVADIGDLTKLKTAVKKDLVSAINSIELTGGGTIPDNIQEILDEINDRLENGDLNENQQESINNLLNIIANNLNKDISKIKEDVEESRKHINEIAESINSDLENIENDYNDKVDSISRDLTSAKGDIEKAQGDLADTKKRLNTIDTNYTNVTKNIDDINGELSTKVDSTEFSSLESKVSHNTTEISQNKEDITLKANKEELDKATGRISDAEAAIVVNANEIVSKVSRSEMNEEIAKVGTYGKNLLRGTRDWTSWDNNNSLKVSILKGTYRHCNIAKIEDGNYFLSFQMDEDDDLKIGETYTASIYVKTETEDNNSRISFYEDESIYEMTDINDNNVISKQWKRFHVPFVASKIDPIISFRFDFLDVNNIGYISAGKIEKGNKTSDWEPNINDDSQSIILTNSTVKQTSDAISAAVETIKAQGEDISTLSTQVNMTGNQIELVSKSIEQIDEDVKQNKANIKINNDNISQKVSQVDVDKSIQEINIDGKNRILNSNFELDFSLWEEKSEEFILKEIDGKNYAYVARNGLTANNIASISSNKFSVTDGQRLTFGFGIYVKELEKYDIRNPIQIELFDIDNIRVAFKKFSIEDLNGKLFNDQLCRLNGKYEIDREDVAKARVKLLLDRNGEIGFTEISLQVGDINVNEWQPAPEDSQLIRAKMETAIDQNAESITLKADKSDMNKLTGDIDNMSAELKIASDSIASLVTKTDDQGTKISKLEQTAERLSSTIAETNTTVSDVKDEVDNIKNNVTYKVELISNNGLTFKNGVIQTTIKAIVYNGKKDVTDSIDANRFVWTKVNADGTFDDVWNQVNASGKKEVPVTKEDVFKRATFFCEITE